MNKRPPKYPLRFFRWFCHRDYVEDIEGDLLERFEKRANEGKAARWLFVLDVLKLLRPGIIKSTFGIRRLNYLSMLKHYLKTAPRVFFKNKIITSISLLSLVVGVLGFQLIYSWVDNEIKTNHFHSNLYNIHTIMLQKTPESKVEPGMHVVDPKEFPTIKSSLTIHIYPAEDGRLVVNNKDFQGIKWVVDSSFFTFFDFPLALGDPKDILKYPTSMVISNSMAKRMFGNENPIGKTVESFTDNEAVYKIAGVLEDFPSSSSMKFDVLIPRHSERFWSRSAKSFVLVDDHFNKEEFDHQIAYKSIFQHQYTEGRLSTRPLSELYFDGNYDRFIYYRYGNINQVWTMSFVGLMIIIISTLNFTNLQNIFHLSTVRPLGIRQVNGARKADLFLQYLINMLVLYLVALGISSLSIGLILPVFERAINFHIDFDFVQQVISIATILGLIISFSLIPAAIRIHRTAITEAFQNKVASVKIGVAQKTITTFQYGISILLIIASLTVYQQYEHLRDKELGYDPTNVIEVDFFDEIQSSRFEDKPEKVEEIKKALQQQKANYAYVLNELKAHPGIVKIAHGGLPVNGSTYTMSWKLDSDGNEYSTQNILTCNSDYAELLKIQLVEGKFLTDEFEGVVINEAARRYWKIELLDSVGLSNASWGDFHVVGVVKDFNYEHLSSEIKPLIILKLSYPEEPLLIKLMQGNELASMEFIENLFMEVNPSGNFDYKSLELELAGQYENEKMIGRVYLSFTIIGIMLSLTGLFAFVMYENRRRTKEVGIRKVHGANLKDIFITLSKSSLIIIFTSIVLAFPIGWFLMERWLENYSYRIGLNPLIFLSTAFIGLVLAFIAIGWQTYRTAKVNPVTCLRDE